MKYTEQHIWELLTTIADPEIPVLSIVDLGIVRGVNLYPQATEQGFEGEIIITPTYSGCPAMDMIRLHINLAMTENNWPKLQVKQQLAPAWTTDWMTENGRKQLQAYGIAPPQGKAINETYLEDAVVPCPQCTSTNTYLISQFGSTSCKALFKCNNCQEPFDYFKCH